MSLSRRDNDGSFDPSGRIRSDALCLHHGQGRDRGDANRGQKQVWDGLKSLQKAQAKHKDPESLLRVAANNEEQVRCRLPLLRCGD